MPSRHIPFSHSFVLAAVSPAVVVPSMLSLHEKGYGVDKGIPTLVIAAASVDDVLAISGFGVTLGIAFSKGLYLSHEIHGLIIFPLTSCVFYQVIWFGPFSKVL